MKENNAYFIGIDIGTQGARVALADAAGNELGNRSSDFPLSSGSREEQSPETWWQACLHCLQQLLQEAGQQLNLAQVKAVSVTSTSGTVIPLDGNNRPLHNAIMYSDGRSGEAAALCRRTATAYNSEGYTAFNTSSGLSKMVWFVQEYPHKAARLRRFIHAADYITGMLCGNYAVTDFTNALKSGYDVQQMRWPAYIWEQLPLQRQWLQQVVAPSTPLGQLAAPLCRELALPATVQVTAGMTDGCASQIAAGAVKPGDWNTTIGTTLVVKGVTEKEIRDPLGRLYCHRHPDGHWMPGGASNTGADWITKDFRDQLAALNEAAASLIPTGQLAWPLLQQGERFPFIAPQARGFAPEGLQGGALFAANMEGVAYIERYAYDMISGLSGEKVKAVYTAGGGSNSDTWLRIRSNVLNLPLIKMQHVSGAMGAAILAASRTHFSTVKEAAAAMTRVEKQVLPEKRMAAAYEEGYRAFVKALEQKGFLIPEG